LRSPPLRRCHFCSHGRSRRIQATRNMNSIADRQAEQWLNRG
jgi:hypothetical protein